MFRAFFLMNLQKKTTIVAPLDLYYLEKEEIQS